MTVPFRPYITLGTLWLTVLKALGMTLALGNWKFCSIICLDLPSIQLRVVTGITFSQSSEL